MGELISSKNLRGTGLAMCYLGSSFFKKLEGDRACGFVIWEAHSLKKIEGDRTCDL